MTVWMKALGPGREAINGGTGVWPEPGVWTERIVDLVPCERGWHVCTPTQMLSWLPDTVNDLWLVEVDGQVVDDGDKTVVERARLVRKLDWTDRTARLFASDCADAVLHLFEAQYPDDTRPREAIAVARRFAVDGVTTDELTAARAAARAAAAAAWPAAAAGAAAGGAAARAAGWAARAARAAAAAAWPAAAGGAAAGGAAARAAGWAARAARAAAAAAADADAGTAGGAAARAAGWAAVGADAGAALGHLLLIHTQALKS